MSEVDNKQESLLKNGLNFILEGLQRLQKTDKSKYGLLNIYSGLLLLLKERIRSEHWTLLFKSINQANIREYKSGDFQSINFEDCINRIENIIGRPVSKNFKEELRHIKRTRNRIEHFKTDFPDKALESLAAQTVSHSLKFIRDFLDENSFHNDDKNILKEIRESLQENEAVIQENEKAAEKEIKKGDYILSCYICDQKYLVVKPGVSCKFCHTYTECAIEAAELYNGKFQWGAGDPREGNLGQEDIIECFDCGDYTAVYDEHGKYTCFECGKSWDTWDGCSNCGTPISEASSISMCKLCCDNVVLED